MPAPSPRLRPTGLENGAVLPRENARRALNPAMTERDTVSEPPAMTRSISPLRIRSAPMPTAELELAQGRGHRDHAASGAAHALDDRSAVGHQGCRDDPGADPIPFVPQDVLRDVLGAHEPAVGAAQADADPVRIEIPGVHARLADRFPVRASMVNSVARSIHDRASASISTGTSSPKLLARSPRKRQAPKRVTFSMESRPSSSACFISSQSRPSGE